MNIVNQLATYFYSLSMRERHNLHIGYIVGLSLLVLIAIIGIHSYATSLREHINKLHKQAREVQQLISKYQSITKQKSQLFEALDNKKDADIKGFVENFYKEHQITPRSNWTTSSGNIKHNPDIEEISLVAFFDDITTQKLVVLIENLNNVPYIYLKALKIIKLADKKILHTEFTLATLQHKSHET